MSGSSSFFRVRAVLIIITVTATTGGFTLGYFVGKNVSSPPTVPPLKQPVNDRVSATSAPNPGSDLKNDAPASAEPVGQIPSTENKRTAVTPVSQETLPLRAEAKVERKEEKKVIYTVQAGAFKRQKDADTLKHKLETKGYDASIKKESNSRGAALFKVRVGEFDKKEDAAVFAHKLKTEYGSNFFAVVKK